ncbi:hypothetical protein A176_000115 [Myxococcus hansupus]|uniref:Uncharacterized protein n=1 Tax=Pseudomyxococcus hansupus TaxID=1297742 RepID=A0A0H4WNQ0_9BACT|nr:hypothetical protein A176_000115 [Myxococcus hansupus]
MISPAPTARPRGGPAVTARRLGLRRLDGRRRRGTPPPSLATQAVDGLGLPLAGSSVPRGLPRGGALAAVGLGLGNLGVVHARNL